MQKSRFLMATALASSSLILLAQPGWAQAAAPQAAEDEAEADSGEIIVTGTRIAQQNLDSSVPITTITGEDIFTQNARTSVGDLLNDLPSLRNTFSQSNSSRFLGTAGLNLLDLRGLGTQRTLVLVNGRRHVGSDILANAVSPDVNTFPTDLIDRIDIVTGGSSAVYGSDAIAGVVNFILKKDYEGVQIRGQGSTTTYGDASAYFVSAVAGKNFADGRGNIAINLEYNRQDPLFASRRPNLRQDNNFVVVDTDPGNAPNGSDGIPDRIFVNDVRSSTNAIAGLIQISPAAGFAPCGRDTAGAAFRCNFFFQPDGSIRLQQGQRVGIAPNGLFIGGDGNNNREAMFLGVFPRLNRYSANVIGHYTVSDAFEPFVEAKYSRTESLSFGSPGFFQGSTVGGGVDLRERPRFDNPFLSDATRAQINAARAQAGLAPIVNPATRLVLNKRLGDLGPRQEEATRETYRIVGGATGTFNDDWKYEISLNYGEFRERTKVLGNFNTERLLLALDAVRDPASGQIVCRSKIDPAAAIINQANDPASPEGMFAQSQLAANVAACVPLNPFGQGNITPAMRNYLLQDTVSVGNIKQFDATAFVSGDTSQFFNLPGGPVGFALGVEYRREKNFFQADDLVAKGQTFFNALPLFDPPAFEVKEVFGELRLPILKDTPFFHELSITGAGRISDYKGSTGTVYAYNGGVEYAPIEDIRFRAGYARSVRAPNLADLFSLQSQNFATVVDPCSARNIGTGSATRAANCAAAGIPASYDFVYTSSLQILSGGNPNLREETSDSYTVGAVFTPRLVPGLSITADYYDITINKVITAPSAQQILNACYDAVNLNNQFCALFQRAGPGGAPSGEVPFQIIEGSLQQTLLNYAKSKTRGIDIDVAFARKLSDIDTTITSHFVYTHVFQSDDFLNPADPGRADQTLFELGDPQNAFNWNTDFKKGPYTLGFQLRYIGKQVVNAYEDFFSKQGRPPENADYFSKKFFPSIFYQDVRAAIDVNKNFNFYGGIQNIFNRKPPLGLTGTGGGSGIYDTRGRSFFVGAKAKF